MPPDEVENIVVSVIREFERKQDAFRHELLAKVTGLEDNFVGLRRDMHAAIAPLQLNQISHDQDHADDKKERVEKQAENVQRFQEIRRDIRDIRIILVIGFFLFFSGLIAVVLLK